LAAIDALAARLRHDEDALRLPRTRPPEHGFAEVAWRWARGQRLEDVLERAEMSPGDFVRNAKQLIDLLRQLAVVAPRREVAGAARRAAHGLERGVVGVSVRPALAEEAPPEGRGPNPQADAVANQARP
jgi:ATP-dependent RNA helicase HelY